MHCSADGREERRFDGNRKYWPYTCTDKNHRQVTFFLGNARTLFDKRWDNNSFLGRLSKLGLAPILWCIILLMLATYIHSVIMASNLPRLTAGFGLFAWMGVFLASIAKTLALSE